MKVLIGTLHQSDVIFRQKLNENGLDYTTIVLQLNVSHLNNVDPVRLRKIPGDENEKHYEYTSGEGGPNYLGDERLFRVFFKTGTVLEGGRLVYVEGNTVTRLDNHHEVLNWRPGPDGLLFVRN